MSNIRLREIFVTEMELEEFLRSVARILSCYVEYADDSDNHELIQDFCVSLGDFVVINNQQLKTLLNFYEKNIEQYEKYKDQSI